MPPATPDGSTLFLPSVSQSVCLYVSLTCPSSEAAFCFPSSPNKPLELDLLCGMISSWLTLAGPSRVPFHLFMLTTRTFLLNCFSSTKWPKVLAFRLKLESRLSLCLTDLQASPEGTPMLLRQRCILRPVGVFFMVLWESCSQKSWWSSLFTWVGRCSELIG